MYEKKGAKTRQEQKIKKLTYTTGDRSEEKQVRISQDLM
jgi:hypothetical protein